MKKIVIIIVILIIVGIVVLYCLNIKKNESDDLNIEEQDESGVEYAQEQLNNFEFELTNIPEEVIEKLGNEEKLCLKVKEYLYKKGMIDATEGKIEEYDIKDDKITLKVVLNNDKKTKLLLSIDL